MRTLRLPAALGLCALTGALALTGCKHASQLIDPADPSLSLQHEAELPDGLYRVVDSDLAPIEGMDGLVRASATEGDTPGTQKVMRLEVDPAARVLSRDD